MTEGVFVTGTDTGVGKTFVACLLAAVWRCGVMKPISTGSRDDARRLRRAAGVRDPIDLINPLHFRAPAAPLAAAPRPIDLSPVWRAWRELRRRHDRLIVEGIGGLLVPIAPHFNVLDLARRLGLPLLIVARPDLGTINHTLLTVRAARGLPIAGIVINHARRVRRTLAVRTAARTIERVTGVRVIAEIPYGSSFRRASRYLRSVSASSPSIRLSASSQSLMAPRRSRAPSRACPR